MIELRPDQLQVVQQLRAAYSSGFKAPLLAAPTGFGKTVVFSHIAKTMLENLRRVVILVHRTELIDQVSNTLKAFNVPHGIIASQTDEAVNRIVQVASVQTLVRRVERYKPPSLVICDEAHHAIESNTWGKIMSAWSCYRLGVTATPRRLSGEPLSLFDTIVTGPSVTDLIAAGNLSPFKIYAPPTVDTKDLHRRGGEFVATEVNDRVSKPKITGDVIAHYKRLADGKRTIVFCPSIEFAHRLSTDFLAAGYQSAAVDGEMPKSQRREIIDDFRSGRIGILTSCALVEEGFDVPHIECGILLTPTLSLVRFMQQCGRCLRMAPGKTSAVILDHVGNVERHGFPDETRQWTLDGKSARERANDEAPSVRVCVQCFAAVPGGTTHCPECGTAFPIKPRKISKEEGELVEAQRRKDERREQGMTQDLHALMLIEKAKGYKKGWAYHVWNARQAKKAASAPQTAQAWADGLEQ